MNEATDIRIPYEELVEALAGILLKIGFSADRAQLSAQLFADASRDGVYSHGVNRFPRFLRSVRSGIVEPRPTCCTPGMDASCCRMRW